MVTTYRNITLISCKKTRFLIISLQITFAYNISNGDDLLLVVSKDNKDALTHHCDGVVTNSTLQGISLITARSIITINRHVKLYLRPTDLTNNNVCIYLRHI